MNVAAGQKASQDINSGPFSSSFAANVPPSAAFVTHGFDSFSAATDTNAQTFGACATNAFAGPVNTFSSAVSQQRFGAFAGTACFSSSSSQPQTTFGFANVDGAGQSQRTADVAASLVYTPLDQLSADERAQFEAPKFTLGRIPVRPPPKELV